MRRWARPEQGARLVAMDMQQEIFGVIDEGFEDRLAEFRNSLVEDNEQEMQEENGAQH